MRYTTLMRYGALFGWGIVLYAVMFLAWAGIVVYGPLLGYATWGLQAFVLLVVPLIVGTQLRLPHWSDIIPYSIGWAVLVACLDAVFAVPFVGWGLYMNLAVWVGYVAVVLVPLFAPAYASWRAGGTVAS